MIVIRAVGTAEIHTPSFVVTPTSPRKFATLLYLSAEAGRRIPRSHVRSMIFGDLTEVGGRHSVREMAYQLRQSGVPLIVSNDAFELSPRDVEWDISALIAGSTPTVDQLLAIGSGLFSGYQPNSPEVFREWFDGYKAAANIQLTAALLRETERRKAASDWIGAATVARACLSLDPFNEAATLSLAESLALTGSKARAIRLLDDYMAEVGRSGSDLRLSAVVLRRRIGEIANGPSGSTDLPLIDRLAELTRLRSALNQAKQKQSAVVVVSGEPGIGKTRLAQEFGNSAAVEGATVIQIRMLAHDRSRPLGAFADLIPKLLELRGALGCSPESVVVLRQLTEVPPNEEAGPACQADSFSGAVLRATADLLDAVSSERTLVLLIDDANLMDPASLRLCTALFSGNFSLRMLGVFTTRVSRELVSILECSRSAVCITLEPLAPSSTERLVRGVFERLRLAIGVEVVGKVVESSRGNPMFAIALASDCATDSTRIPSPRSLLELLERRLLALSTRDLAIVTTLVAFGQHASARRIASALDIGQLDLLQALLGLSERGIITRSDEIVQPAHPLIADALRAVVPPVIGAVANWKVADILETEAADSNSPSMLWAAAECWLKAGELRRGSRALKGCADHASRIGRPGESAYILRRACSLDIPSKEKIALLTEMVRAAHLAGESQMVLDGIAELRGIGFVVDHSDLELAAISAALEVYVAKEDVEAQLLSCIGCESASTQHRLSAAIWLLKYADVAGKPSLMKTAHDAFSTIPLSAGDALQSVEFQMVYASATGEYDESVRKADELLSGVQDLPQANQFRYVRNAAVALLRAGETCRALGALERVYENARGASCIQGRALAAIHLASIYEDLFDTRTADNWLSRANIAIAEIPTVERPLHFWVYEIDRALARELYDEASTLYDLALQAGIFDRGPITIRWQRVIRSRLATANAEPHSVDVESAIQIATSGAPSVSGIRDAEVTCAIAALTKAGRLDDARKILDDFLTSERVDRRILTATLERSRQALFEAPPIAVR